MSDLSFCVSVGDGFDIAVFFEFVDSGLDGLSSVGFFVDEVVASDDPVVEEGAEDSVEAGGGVGEVLVKELVAVYLDGFVWCGSSSDGDV